MAKKNIVSDEVYEAINSQPAWIIQNGLLFTFCVVILLVGLSNFITYPESSSFPIKIVNESGNFNYSWPISGKKDVVFSKAGGRINKGEKIGIIYDLKGLKSDTVYSPINGTFYLAFDFKSSRKSFRVIADSTAYTIYGSVNDAYARKIKKGLPVKIDIDNAKIDDLPAELDSISSLPVNQQYFVIIKFRDPPDSTYQQIIGFSDSVNGSAKIEINRQSLFQKIFKRIISF